MKLAESCIGAVVVFLAYSPITCVGEDSAVSGEAVSGGDGGVGAFGGGVDLSAVPGGSFRRTIDVTRWAGNPHLAGTGTLACSYTSRGEKQKRKLGGGGAESFPESFE